MFSRQSTSSFWQSQSKRLLFIGKLFQNLSKSGPKFCASLLNKLEGIILVKIWRSSFRNVMLRWSRATKTWRVLRLHMMKKDSTLMKALEHTRNSSGERATMGVARYSVGLTHSGQGWEWLFRTTLMLKHQFVRPNNYEHILLQYSLLLSYKLLNLVQALLFSEYWGDKFFPFPA
jgi:hypothetical protein